MIICLPFDKPTPTSKSMVNKYFTNSLISKGNLFPINKIYFFQILSTRKSFYYSDNIGNYIY